MNRDTFIETVKASFLFKKGSILVGSAIFKDDTETGVQITLPLKTFNRHGLIAGATGTGKTKTLQLITESLSQAGVPVLVMDMKGDLSGLGAAATTNTVIESRAHTINMAWKGEAFPVEFLSISEEPGVRLRATISEYGPVLLSKILELNETQAGVLAMIFKFCDDRNLPLLDLKDLKSVLNYFGKEGKEEFQKEYGFVQPNSAGTIMRHIVALEQQNADDVFGEPSFDVFDLMKKASNGYGMINVLRLTDMQSKPALFSTFMLCLLAEIFQKMPEAGDPDKPELVIFIDEAHLIFKNATKSLIEQLEITVKLIRSKGVGIYFVTQSPDDIPAAILGQLGTKVQHALRAFTAKDRKAIKLAAENYPFSEFYKVNDLITQIGTGEALITTLNEKGKPTELVHTLMRPPYSRMDVLTDGELSNIIATSRLTKKYNVNFDRESAYEILQERLQRTVDMEAKQPNKGEKPVTPKRTSKELSTFDKVMKSSLTHTIARELTRGLLGVLGLKSVSRSTSRSRSKR